MPGRTGSAPTRGCGPNVSSLSVYTLRLADKIDFCPAHGGVRKTAYAVFGGFGRLTSKGG